MKRLTFTWALGTLTALLIFASSGLAQVNVSMQPGVVELEREQGVAGVPGDGPDREPGSEQDQQREFVIAPLPSRDPLLGWTLAVPALWLYKPQSASDEDSMWITGAAAFYSENESFGAGLFHRMSIGGDRWRLTGAAFSAELNYDYFGIGEAPDVAIPLTQDVDFLLVEALRRVAPNLYLGLRGQVSESVTGIDFPGSNLPESTQTDELSLDLDLNSIVPRLTYDSRDSQFYPRGGWLVEGNAVISRDSLGSDLDYELHKWSVNRYQQVTDSAVLAVRVATEYAAGDTPFFLYPAFGAGSDLRGYQTGTYRDRFLFAAQAEWRQDITPRWRAVGFAGIGTVAPDALDWGRSLSSMGVGLRWVVAPKNNMSLRVDVAWGRGDSEFYIGLGEAF